jgi:hypothetical protein
VTYNTTYNLTGPILLGLGIATALLIYMFKAALRGDEGHYGHGKVRPLTSRDTNSWNFGHFVSSFLTVGMFGAG